MELIITTETILIALGIFALRVCDMAFDTVRVLFVVRGRKQIAWILGFMQSLIFVIAISTVLTNLKNPLSILGYAAGFATGNVIGMIIEERLAIGFIQLSIVSPRRGSAIAELLREHGYAVTELSGRGRSGTVTMLNVSVMRRQVVEVETLILESDPEAFVTAEEVRPLRRGFWRA
jgi:uncharacterized protein YebE (UPF0316 family)